MQSSITRLALFQFLTVFYCILGVGVMVKAHGAYGPAAVFATRLRDYGFILLILPVIWLIWASITANRPRVGTGDLPPILSSGLLLLGVLVVVAFAGTLSAGRGETRIQQSPPQNSRFTDVE